MKHLGSRILGIDTMESSEWLGQKKTDGMGRALTGVAIVCKFDPTACGDKCSRNPTPGGEGRNAETARSAHTQGGGEIETKFSSGNC